MDNPFAVLERRLNRLEALLLDLKAASGQPKQTELPARLTKKQALNFLKDQGIIISESHLYKLTASRGIPYQKFNNKLVFSREELLHWIENQTASPGNDDEVTLTLARSARRKQKGGKHDA
ncbi:hypothetical protein CLV24_11989 [Pontibacter ummariensis]|uniref:Helix-turn-helix domain-containing protein n=2 Tax=Pontibacter ummariensis TaxID=1610492 RepID=A0A239IZS2_9BACT|nr:hypothetical protein CLV24_11989 [Pontibacter ummariensis]SNS98892.1 hypothetical protein SAMN06296052_11989 [Pontibacter ummariensis]